jgi:hypothetical protein
MLVVVTGCAADFIVLVVFTLDPEEQDWRPQHFIINFLLANSEFLPFLPDYAIKCFL